MATGSMLLPKLFTTLKAYSRDQFDSDLTAGLIVGVVALPPAIAFAIASGVTPRPGALHRRDRRIHDFGWAAPGGKIGGPTGAFVVIVYGIVQKYGVDGLTGATITAGLLAANPHTVGLSLATLLILPAQEG